LRLEAFIARRGSPAFKEFAMVRDALVRSDARPARVRAASLFGVIFSLSACAGTSGSGRYQALTLAYDRAAVSSARAEQAQAGNVARERVLDRAAFVRAVLARNPTIESARQGFRAAIARVEQSGAFDDPMLELELAPLSVRSLAGSGKGSFGYQVRVSQALPWFGKRALDASVAAAEAEAAKSDFEGTRRELALAALSLYDQYFVTYRSAEINSEHVRLVESLRDAALAQFSSGRGSAQDALQAEAELTHMEHDAVILASQREVLKAQMNELLHRAPSEALPPPSTTLDPGPSAKRAPGELESEALRDRVDIAAVRSRARAAEARAERAERDAYPDFTVSTSYNSMWDMPEHRWMVGVGFNLPVFSGKRTGAAHEARALGAQLQSELLRMSDMARTQVFVTLKQLEESEHVLLLFETRLLPIARQRIDAARAGFITAQNPFMAVIESERALRNLELQYQTARAEYARRQAELERALGKIPGLSSKGEEP
jgi:outer membrane protein TolC